MQRSSADAAVAARPAGVDATRGGLDADAVSDDLAQMVMNQPLNASTVRIPNHLAVAINPVAVYRIFIGFQALIRLCTRASPEARKVWGFVSG